MRGVEDRGVSGSVVEVDEASVKDRLVGKNRLDCLCSKGGKALLRLEIGCRGDGLERSDAIEVAVGREGML